MRNGGSWAVSFGMPSRDPEIWRRDISETRRALASHQILSVSVVASPEPGWSVEEIAGDFLRCAKWAAQSGADAVEMNFSCPNVSSADGQLYQNPAAAGFIASDVRRELGTVPLLVKIGHITDEALAMRLFQAVSPHVNALVMVNCVTARVADEQGNALFGGERRGIAGGLIRAASLEQVQLFREIRAREESSCELIGGGGISTRGRVQEFLDAGCGAVQIATAAMLNPDPRELFFRG
jgi:dihydroorotate dehydrogenase